MILASIFSISTVIMLIVLKVFAYIITGSIAMLSSLFDSIQDCMTSTINLIAVHHAIMPADNQHRFGHGKAQGIGSLVQICIISISAIFLAKESLLRLLDKQKIIQIDIGIIVSVIAVVLTGLLITFQSWVIKQTNSLCIKTDKAHYTGDILMNIGVLISLIMSSYWGWTWIDGAFGIAVSIYLVHSMIHIAKETLAMLMDKELPEHVRKKIKSVALSVPSVLNVSDLKTRQVGTKIFIQFAVQFDGKITLDHAHKCIDIIEEKLYTLYPDCEIIVHAEPFIACKRRKS